MEIKEKYTTPVCEVAEAATWQVLCQSCDGTIGNVPEVDYGEI